MRELIGEGEEQGPQGTGGQAGRDARIEREALAGGEVLGEADVNPTVVEGETELAGEGTGVERIPSHQGGQNHRRSGPQQQQREARGTRLRGAGRGARSLRLGRHDL